MALLGLASSRGGGAIPYNRHYTYDNAGRLTQVNDRTAASSGVDVTDPAEAPPCVTRTYGFDRNDNRQTTAASAAANGSCSTSGATTVTRSFDTADRPVTGANGTGTYTYDALGRTTTLPASDAPKTQNGDVTLAYYDNDLARSVTQAGTTTTFTLDALDRRSVETITNVQGTVRTIQRHYTDTSDNPTWTTTTEGTTTSLRRYVGGDLSMTITGQGDGELTLASPHGDIVTTVLLPGTPTDPASSIEGWNSYDEYGNPVLRTSVIGSVDYGWLGAKQRATGGAGLILMGVRLYNPATGLFTSLDPVVGGNANSYTYPADPVNSYDLDGRNTVYGDSGFAWLYVKYVGGRWKVQMGFRLYRGRFYFYVQQVFFYWSRTTAGAWSIGWGPYALRYRFERWISLRRGTARPVSAFGYMIAYGYRITWWGVSPTVFYSGFLWDRS